MTVACHRNKSFAERLIHEITFKTLADLVGKIEKLERLVEVNYPELTTPFS